MTDIRYIQKSLLEILEEVDAICRKYDIDYYLAGGSLIGAVRHGGFLPWDDDTDILMTWNNLCKFKEALKKENRSDRFLHHPGYHNNPNPHYRYKRTTDTQLIRGNIGTDVKEGIFVDIFVLYPLPLDEEKKKRCIEDWKLYIELTMKYYNMDSRRPRPYLTRYYRAKRWQKLIGEDRVFRYLEKRVSQYPEEEAEEWLIGSPCPPKFTTEKKWWGKPRYIDFETTQLPVQEHAERSLCDAYGPTWFEVPAHEERGEHVNVIDPDIPYTAYTGEYHKYIDKEQLLREKLRTKKTWFKLLWDRCIVMPQLRELQGLDAFLEVQGAVETHQIDLKSWVLQGREKALEDLFRPWLNKVNSHSVKYYGVYLDMPDAYLYAALYFSCFNGNYGTARRVLKMRREQETRAVSKDLQRLCDLCDATDELLTLLYGELDLAKSRELVDVWLDREPDALYFIRADIYLRLNGFGAEPDEALLSRCEKGLAAYPGDGELLKYQGDLLLRAGETAEAEKCYREALCSLKNGFCIREIKTYFKRKNLEETE